MKEKECLNCDFDTFGIVTVSTKQWSHCPKCGSQLTERNYSDSEDDNIEKDSDNVTEIPIGSNNSEENTQNEQDNKEEVEGFDMANIEKDEGSDIDVETPEDRPDGFETSSEKSETDEIIDREMDQLRKQFGDDEDEDE